MQPLSFRSRKWTLSSPKEPSKVGHGWNLYVVDTVTPLALYQEMVRLPLLWGTALFLYADCKDISSHDPNLVYRDHLQSICVSHRLNTASIMQRARRPTVFGTSLAKPTSSSGLLCSTEEQSCRVLNETLQSVSRQSHRSRRTTESWIEL